MNKEVTKSFLENVDYLRELSKEVSKKKIKDFDSNLIYEVAYADVLLDNLIVQNNNIELSKELKEIQGVFKMILSSVPEEDVVKSKRNLDYKNILRQKYSDINDASYEKSYQSNVSTLQVWFTSNIFRYVFIAVILFFMLIDKQGLLSSLFPNVNDIFINAFCTIANFVSMLVSMVLVLTITFDLFYISVPAMRATGVLDTFVSQNTKLVVKNSDGFMGYTTYSKVKDFNRIERNKVWLNTMIDSLNESKSNSSLLNKLEALRTEITNCTSNSLRYRLYARIEFLRDEYLNQVCEG